MQQRSSRRVFLATLETAGTISVSGCSTLFGGNDPSPSSPSNAEPTTRDSSRARTTTSSTEGPFTRGAVVDDFEGDVSSRWDMLVGATSTDKQDSYRGTQSLAIQPINKEKSINDGVTVNAGLLRSFDEEGGLDLRTHDLSIAIKVDPPAVGQVFFDILAPTFSRSIISECKMPSFFKGWTRIDLGYTGKSGKPDMSSVRALRIRVHVDSRPLPTITIDDIRKHPKSDTGKVMFLFDSHPATYTAVFPQLNQRDWQAGVVDVPPSVHKADTIPTEQMRTMRDAGWDMMAAPPGPQSKAFPELPVDEQERRIRETKRTLERKGFPQGARHVLLPANGSDNNETVELVQEYHRMNYASGGAPNNATHPSNLYDISYRHSKYQLPIAFFLAAEFNQMIALGYPAPASIGQFEKQLRTVEKTDIDIVSPSQFLDSIRT